MRYLSNREMRPGGKSTWRHNKRHHAICPKCGQKIAGGAWVRRAPGVFGVIKHVQCPRGRA